MYYLIFPFLLLLAGCKDKDMTMQNAELVFFNGEIYTVNPNQEWASEIGRTKVLETYLQGEVIYKQ